MEFFDRVPTYPGRVRLVPVPGQANTYDMVRADEPRVEGTPVNKALFESFNSDIEALAQRVDDKVFEVSQRVRVADLVDGSLFGLYESGVLVPFIKLKSDYPTSGRILAVRKNCVTSDYLANTGEELYKNCRADLWLNNEYISRLDTATQSVLASVDVEVWTDFGVGEIGCKVFLLSLYEYNMTSNNGISIMGDNLSYFSPAERRIATLNGTPVNHWTRSSYNATNNAAYITVSGEHAIVKQDTFIAGIRPALTLPDDFEVTVSVPSPANTMATAEVIE